MCVTKLCLTNRCHTCHATHRWMSPSATPATRNQGGCHQVPHLPRKNQDGFHQVPRLPRKVAWRPGRPSAPNRATRASPVSQVPGGWMSPSATPPTQVAAGDRARPSAPPEPTQCRKYHACHAKPRWMSPSGTPATQSGAAPRETQRAQARQSQPSAASATPATQNASQRRQVPRLRRTVPRKGVCERWCVTESYV